MREALVFHTEADGVGLGCSDLPDAVTESEHPEHSRIHSESDSGVAMLHPPERRPTDLRSLSDHLGREAPAPTRSLNVGPELRQSTSDCDRNKWRPSWHT